MARSLYHQKRSKRSYRRAYGGRKSPRARILIICEGERTEPLYFKSFRVSSVHADIEGTGRNTDSLVEYAMAKVKTERKNNNRYDQVWCVFDKDDFSAQNFNRAFDLARSNKIKIAYSNEAFEL